MLVNLKDDFSTAQLGTSELFFNININAKLTLTMTNNLLMHEG